MRSNNVPMMETKIELFLQSISIEEETLKEGKEMVEDLVLAATKQAMDNADKKAEEMMKSVTGGMMPNLPGF